MVLFLGGGGEREKNGNAINYRANFGQSALENFTAVYLAVKRVQSFSLPQGPRRGIRVKYAYCTLSFRRRLKDSRVASRGPRRVVFMRRKFPGRDKNLSLRGATPDGSGGNGGCDGMVAACNYLLMTHKPAIFSWQQAACSTCWKQGDREERRNFPRRRAAPRSHRKSVRNHRSVWRQVRCDRWRTKVWDLQRARQLMSQLFLPSSFAPTVWPDCRESRPRDW